MGGTQTHGASSGERRFKLFGTIAESRGIEDDESYRSMPWTDVGRSLLARLRKPVRLDFIHLHYMYFISSVIIGGACTQAGLNTVDINSLSNYQQAVLYVLPLFTNPITVNFGIVLIRLRWFRKRFEHIVREAQLQLSARRTMSRTRSRQDIEERGVGGREIRVLLNGGRFTEPRGRNSMPVGESMELSLQRPPSHNTIASSHEGDLSSRAGKKPSSFADGHADNAASATESDATNQPLPKVGSPDIRFADLPQPRRLSVDQQGSSHIAFANAPIVDRPEVAPLFVPRPQDVGGTDRDDPAESNALRRIKSAVSHRRRNSDLFTPTDGSSNVFSRRTLTVDSRTPVYQVRKATGVDIPHSLTFERVLSGAFRNRKREGSPTSRRSTRTNVELPYLSYAATVGRNSTFVDLTPEQRQELGGIEYRSLVALVWVLGTYFVFLHVFGIVSLLVFVYTARGSASVVDAAGAPRAWWAIFTAASSFNDVGFTLTPDSFLSLQRAAFLLLVCGFLVVVGNTGFPVFLRFYIWVLSKLVPDDSPRKEPLAFLLDHPRRCFTLLFPSGPTWWLFAILVGLNVIDVILFIILDLGDTAVQSIPGGYRFVAALFQAIATRTAGFGVVSLTALHPAILVSYMVMMYISVYPVAINVRRTNVYEERSLGIYSGDDLEEQGTSFVGTHIRRQLSFDLWYVFLGLFLIAIIENRRISEGDYAFNMFYILFEVVSAYGTVGLSTGYPTINASLSAEFHTLSKLVIIALQIRGRHRGLPVSLDRAVVLPGEHMVRKEEEDNAMRGAGRRRSMSMSLAEDRDDA
ncbi:hypothetical protein G7K_3375-t1 [Saitoella complicata NRRL Y-17804]|uniref:Potassium transport protein n=1 Tax=Saitoella complicata (strain BCRC 22490 / CBS 7301 / JCM 7358 / NBRC 10748 / NRRL Y-17804) TaxID=698492 RepID=A0A0E9NH53_SAICN|nr:hypothetical protein G7K_3375-t1 [Saitoella complicata NRRL Y-17804]